MEKSDTNVRGVAMLVPLIVFVAVLDDIYADLISEPGA